MRALCIVLVFAMAEASAQSTEQRGASGDESTAVANIVDCMVAGLPEDWKQATMEINLEKPFDETGSVRYVFSREEGVTPSEPFQPCDTKMPAKTLIDLRKHQPTDRQGWIGAQMTILRDGRFGLRYGFPKPKP